jgi:hypothetical protein
MARPFPESADLFILGESATQRKAKGEPVTGGGSFFGFCHSLDAVKRELSIPDEMGVGE